MSSIDEQALTILEQEAGAGNKIPEDAGDKDLAWPRGCHGSGRDMNRDP